MNLVMLTHFFSSPIKINEFKINSRFLKKKKWENKSSEISLRTRQKSI